MKDKGLFIAKSLIFLGLLLGIMSMLNIGYDHFITQQKLQFRQEHDLQEFLKTNTLEVLFLGSSHTHTAARASLIPNAFNYANGANTYIENYHKVRRLIAEQGVIPKKLLLEIDMHSFSSYMLEYMPLLTDIWYYGEFMSFEEIAKVTDRTQAHIAIAYLWPFIGKTGEIKYIFSPNRSEYELGWLKKTADFSQMETERLIQQRANVQFKGKKRIDPLLMEYFQKILRLARTYEIEVVFVRYPHPQGYAETLKTMGIERESYYNEIMAGVDEILPSYRSFDYYDLLFDHAEYFSDPDHVNDIGAEIVSKKIAEELL